ncbi:MAG: 4-(cytidine 5'-diphospho)-2-C-methyl-D-erythritol kinase [Bacteroidetes bacterium]|nr:4-(cytidine 5'-diphospho)-2-C-methyl-D-erythritol kinase [Bacteroidota bacterium]
MLRFPPAKINLGLHITSKRADGYHNLETIFYPLPQLRDALEIVPAANSVPALQLSGRPVQGKPENNLVWKAFKLLQARYPSKIPALDFYLHKVIPMGAGLGGGSADAAFALMMLNEIGTLGLSQAELESLALSLGSDCPFFIRNEPQFAAGRGERMEPVALDLSGYRIQVVCPEILVSTSEAFRQVQPRPASFPLRSLPETPLAEWRHILHNDFEDSVFPQYPKIQAAKEALYAEGALYASMSGSGSAVFGIFGRQ